jgi:hypothetical protein
VTKAIFTGLILILVMSCLPERAPAQEATIREGGMEYVEGEVEEEIVGGLRLATGKHGRKMWRIAFWVNTLTGDMARVFDSYGVPSSRYREETLGRVEETWTYLSEGLAITFHGDKIVRTREFMPTTGPDKD